MKKSELIELIKKIGNAALAGIDSDPVPANETRFCVEAGRYWLDDGYLCIDEDGNVWDTTSPHDQELEASDWGKVEKPICVLLNHSLSSEQVMELSAYGQIIPTPDFIKNVWGNISPDDDKEFNRQIELVSRWLNEVSPVKVVIAGEPGAVNKIVNHCKDYRVKFNPCYATTKRVSVEKLNEDGSVTKTNVFKHVQFRDY